MSKPGETLIFYHCYLYSQSQTITCISIVYVMFSPQPELSVGQRSVDIMCVCVGGGG